MTIPEQLNKWWNSLTAEEKRQASEIILMAIDRIEQVTTDNPAITEPLNNIKIGGDDDGNLHT